MHTASTQARERSGNAMYAASGKTYNLKSLPLMCASNKVPLSELAILCLGLSNLNSIHVNSVTGAIAGPCR
jgi:hypothetical protein